MLTYIVMNMLEDFFFIIIKSTKIIRDQQTSFLTLTFDKYNFNMSFNFFSNKRKVIPSKITFTEPTKPALKNKESLSTSTDESQKNKKQKTISPDSDTTATDASAASSSTDNNAMETENISSTNISTDWSEDVMSLDASNNNKSGEFENSLLTLNNPAAETASQNKSASTTRKGISETDQTNDVE